MEDFWKTLLKYNPRNFKDNSIKYLERFLLFIFDILSSSKTRRYIADYLIDNFFVLKVKISAAANSKKG